MTTCSMLYFSTPVVIVVYNMPVVLLTVLVFVFHSLPHSNNHGSLQRSNNASYGYCFSFSFIKKSHTDAQNNPTNAQASSMTYLWVPAMVKICIIMVTNTTNETNSLVTYLKIILFFI